MSEARISRRALLQLAALSTASACAGGIARAPSKPRTKPVAEPPPKKPTSNEREWRATGSDVPEFVGFDRAFRSFMQQHAVPGASFALAYRGRLVFARGYSWGASETITPASLFRIASVSKPLTSAAMMRLVQSGTRKLSLSDKLVARVPMTPPKGQRRDPRLADVTLLDLLQHTAGWNRDVPKRTAFDPMFIDPLVAQTFGVPLPISRENIIDYMAGQHLQFAPGAQQSYSNFGYCLLGRVIEHVTDQSYGEFLRANVFGPLGMKGIRLGRSLAAQRAPHEVRYVTADTREYPSVFAADRTAPLPYGTFNLENLDAHGGWLSSSVDLVRFSASFTRPKHPFLDAKSIDVLYGVPKAGRAAERGQRYGCWSVQATPGNVQWRWHDGSLPGTLSQVAQRSDGPAWAFLLNQRDDASDPNGAHYGTLATALDDLVSDVKKWPDHDLFDEYPG